MTNEYKSTRLGDLLVETSAITRQQLVYAIELQQLRRQHAIKINAPDSYTQELGELLIELGYINRSQLKSGLGWQKRLRKTTAAMVFIAPLLTAACGGGSGGGGGTGTGTGTGTNSTHLSLSSSLTVSSEPVTNKPTSSAAVFDQVENTDTGNSSSRSNLSSAIRSSGQSADAASSSSKPSVVISPDVSSTPASSMKNSSSRFATSSVPVSPLSSSSLSSQSSSKSSSISSASEINGPVQIYWRPPTQRENGDFLDITELGGYELRYKRKSASEYTKVIIKDGYVDAYYFADLQGEYEFQIAAFDANGLYSAFVPVKPQ